MVTDFHLRPLTSVCRLTMSDPRSLRFTRPELLRSLAPELLRELLERFPAFLIAAGLDLEALGSHEKRFTACRPLIAELVKNGPTTPTPLVEALFTVSVLAEPEPTEELWHTLTQAGIAILPDASLADLALTLWLRAPEKARQLYIERVQLRTRSFETHAAQTYRKTTPLRPICDGVLNELRRSSELFFIKHNRPSGCQVFVYQRGKEHWFMIRRGDRFKRVATLDTDGRGDTAGYYAEAFDVVVVDPEAEHIHIHAEGVRATRMYSALFGFVLYGRETHFEDCARFTLEPLRKLGRAALVCTDVPGINWVKLTELHRETGTVSVGKFSHKAPDLFDTLEGDHLSIKPNDRLRRAVLLFRFKDDPKPRRVTIKPDNQTSYEHDEDSRLVSEWMTKREFAKINLPAKGVQDVAHLDGL
jgi:hypothetical protein